MKVGTYVRIINGLCKGMVGRITAINGDIADVHIVGVAILVGPIEMLEVF